MFLRKNLPAFIWTLVILGLCSMPGRSIPHISWLELLSFDKFVHASIFFILVVLYLKGFSQQTMYPFLQKHKTLIVVPACILYGGALEIMQATLFSERSADLYDFIANSFGCLMALAFFKPLARKINYLRP